MAKRRAMKTTPRTWLIRGGMAIAAGIAVGFAVGAVGVRMLQPRGMLAAAPVVDNARKPPEPSANEQPAANAETERPRDGIVVPELIGLEEGDARQAISRAGFTVGSVTFKSGVEPLGTVVASFPVPGEAVALPAMVNLILSDGKGKADSAAVPPYPDDNSFIIPNAS